MADDTEIRRINWTEVFSFTQIFKSFKLAMHFSKLVLALAAIVLIYVFGTIMDGLWGTFGSYVAPNEITNHFTKSDGDFAQFKTDWEKGRASQAAKLVQSVRSEKYDLDKFRQNYIKSSYLRDAFLEKLSKYKEENEKDYQAKVRETQLELQNKTPDWDDLLAMAKADFKLEIAKLEWIIKEAKPAAQQKVNALSDKEKVKAQAELDESLKILPTGIPKTRLEFSKAVEDIRGQTIFKAFREYELQCMGGALDSVLRLNFAGGLDAYRAAARSGADVARGPAVNPNETPGLICWVLLSLQGLSWLLTTHWIYGPIFLLLALATWAVFGGAIYRIAALHAAREEKMSAMQALRFSIGKFLSFLTAPLLPLGLMLLVGVGIMLAGLVLNLAVLDAVVGLLFVLVLIAGLAIAFLLVGWFFGGSLMYPTIAVEGSDSFDAMSRSFSYVLNRPWRSLLYGLVAVVYGTITYLFVRFFVFLALISSRAFLKVTVGMGETMGPAADKVDVVWAQPTFDNLWGSFNWEAMGWFTDNITATLIGFWTFLLAGLVLAYLVSYFASASTVIYLLLRRQVDATDTDDVYVEEADENLPAVEPTAKTEVPPAATAPETQATAVAPTTQVVTTETPSQPTAPSAPAEPSSPSTPPVGTENPPQS